MGTAIDVTPTGVLELNEATVIIQTGIPVFFEELQSCLRRLRSRNDDVSEQRR